MGKIIEGIQNLWSLFLQDTINFLALADGYSSKDKKIREQARELRKKGIIILPGFIPAGHCDKLYALTKDFISKHPETETLSNGTHVEYRGRNDGPDSGMIDIFRIDRSVEEINEIDVSLADEIMKNVSGMNLYLSRINLYYNREISNTRIDHVDNCQPVIYKGFLYLTDVEDESYGPYSFTNGTQRFSFPVYFNLFANMFKKKYRITDMPVTFGYPKTIATGKKGTLVLSNQNGIHRGLPQGENRERMAIIFNYLQLSKLNYKHKTIKEALKDPKRVLR